VTRTSRNPREAQKQDDNEASATDNQKNVARKVSVTSTRIGRRKRLAETLARQTTTVRLSVWEVAIYAMNIIAAATHRSKTRERCARCPPEVTDSDAPGAEAELVAVAAVESESEEGDVEVDG
jgi:hypothetical protein